MHSIRGQNFPFPIIFHIFARFLIKWTYNNNNSLCRHPVELEFWMY
jgi:hypothetical protein